MGATHQALLMIGSGVTTSAVGQSLLYSGNGSAGHAISGADFSPNWVIVRDRAGGATTQWRCQDTARGAGLDIPPSTSSAESSISGISSFDANGFTLGNAAQWNQSSHNYMALLFKIVSNAVDIVTYSGTGVAHTISHSLGATPEMIWVKNRSNGSRNWAVYSSTLGNTKGINLDSTNGSSTQGGYWNNTSPTSSVFTVGTSTLTNESGSNFVAYLFATRNPGVKVGSYTGDGNTNGPAQTTNFKAHFVIIKRTDAVGSWYVFEDQADPSSPHNIYNVLTGGATAEATTVNSAGGVDFTSTAWQGIDTANADINVNGASYIYLAIG